MKPTKTNRFSLLLATSGLIFSGALYAQTVEIDPVGAIPGTHTQVKAWEFDTDGDPEGWAGTNFGPLTVAGGVISGSVTSGDPQLTSTFTALPLGYSTIVEFKVTVDPLVAAASGGGTVFWADYGGGIAGGKSKAISVPEDAQPHTVRLTFPGGVKNLTSLRLDPTAGGFPKNVSFDYVRVYHYQPASFTDVTLTADDASGATSMNSAGGWDSLAAPTTESNYFTGAFQLRTQAGGAYLPFGGSALSIDTGGSMLLKASGGNLIRQLTLAGGSILHGATGATPDTAKLFVPDGISVTAASTLDTVAPTRTIEVTGSLNGSGDLAVKGLVPGAGQTAGQVVLKSDSTSYTGALTVDSNALLDLDHDNAVAGASVIVNANGQVRRNGTDADGTTTAASWAITGRGPLAGTDNTRGAIYFNRDGFSGTLAGPISVSGAQARIGMYSGGTNNNLTLGGNITGTGTLELWGGGGAETHVQRFILNGTSTLDGQTDLLADFGSQSHLRLGGDDRLATNRKLRLSATWAASPTATPPGTPEGAGAFLDLNGFDQTLSNLQLDGVRRKVIHDTTASGNSVLTLSAANNAFDTNGGNVYINGITITHTGATADSGAQIDNASVVTLTGATWNAPFYTSLGNSGDGTLVLINSTFSFGGELLMARSNNKGTLTVDSTSLATTPNYFRIGDSVSGVATVNLNGGTLAARGFRNLTTSTSILNLNGGMLEATNSNMADWITGVTVNLLAGGITLDSNNHQVRSLAPILEDAGSTGGGITKIGTGNVTLAGANTYTGATAITEGNLLIDGDSSAATGATSVSASAGLGGDGIINGATYADGANFPWIVTDWTAAPDLNAGTVTINGALTVLVDDNNELLANFTEADATFTILSASLLTVTNPAGLAVDASGFTIGTGTWEVQQDGNTLKLVYTAGAASGYSVWANAYAPGQAADLDHDNDGVSNGVEYFMGETGSTFTNNPGVIGDKITWPKDPAFIGSFKVQISDTLALGSWTDIVPPDANINETNPDEVIYSLPTGAPKKFARLSVTVTP